MILDIPLSSELVHPFLGPFPVKFGIVFNIIILQKIQAVLQRLNKYVATQHLLKRQRPMLLFVFFFESFRMLFDSSLCLYSDLFDPLTLHSAHHIGKILPLKLLGRPETLEKIRHQTLLNFIECGFHVHCFNKSGHL